MAHYTHNLLLPYNLHGFSYRLSYYRLCLITDCLTIHSFDTDYLLQWLALNGLTIARHPFRGLCGSWREPDRKDRRRQIGCREEVRIDRNTGMLSWSRAENACWYCSCCIHWSVQKFIYYETLFYHMIVWHTKLSIFTCQITDHTKSNVL